MFTVHPQSLKKKKIKVSVARHSQFLVLGDVEEVRGVRLQLDEGGRGQQRVPHQHELVLLDTQVRHQLNRRKEKESRDASYISFVFMAIENHYPRTVASLQL